MWIEAKAKARPDYSRSKGGEFGLSVAQLNDYIRVEELTGAPVQISLFDLSSLSVYGIPLRDWILAGREGGGFTWVPVNIFKHPFDVSFARDHVFLDFILHMIELALLDTNKTLDFPRLDELLDWYEEQP